jgi:hypothetical protein
MLDPPVTITPLVGSEVGAVDVQYPVTVAPLACAGVNGIVRLIGVVVTVAIDCVVAICCSGLLHVMPPLCDWIARYAEGAEIVISWETAVVPVEFVRIAHR